MRYLATFMVGVFCLVSAVAWAEEAEEGEEEASETVAYRNHILEGHRLFTNNEHEAALQSYQSALEVQPDDAMAVYLIACAQRATGDLDAALASFQRSASLAGSDAALEARALMNVAFVQEARRDLPAAREAWQAYITFAEAHQTIPTYVPNARERLDAITAVEELEAAYAPVRQRIEERAASQESSGD